MRKSVVLVLGLFLMIVVSGVVSANFQNFDLNSNHIKKYQINSFPSLYSNDMEINFDEGGNITLYLLSTDSNPTILPKVIDGGGWEYTPKIYTLNSHISSVNLYYNGKLFFLI